MSKKEASFLIALFSEFELRHIRWAILRNAKEVPNNIGNDVDILVDSKLLKVACRSILEVASLNNIAVVGIIKKYQYICVLLEIGKENRAILPIDLLGGCFTRGVENVNSQSGLDHREYLDGLWVVSKGFEAAATLMKELLPHGVVAERCRCAIFNGTNSEPEIFLNALKGILTLKISEKLLGYCRQCDWDSIARISKQVRNDVNRLQLKCLYHISGYLFATIKHYLDPKFSCFVVIIGPDGSGKTTVANELFKSMKKNPFKITKHIPTNFGVLPKLSNIKIFFCKLLGQNFQKAEEPIPGAYLSGMETPVHSPIRGSIYVIWYGLDMFLGRLFLRRWRGQGGLIVFARYYTDYYFQRAHIKTPKWLKDLVKIVVPTPEIIFSIQRSPQDIFDGKPELSVQEIGRQQNAIDIIMRRSSNAYVLEGSFGVAHTVQQAEKIIINCLKKKFKDVTV